MPEVVAEEEEDEEHVLRKLKPKIPDHNDAHPVAENMKPMIPDHSGGCLIPMLSGEGMLLTTGSILRNSRISMRRYCWTRSL